MESYWLAAYLMLVLVAIGQSLLLLVQTWEHRRYVRSCMRGLKRHYPSGRAAVFAPCKGIDVDLEGNLRAVLRQDYDDYEVTFIVECADDPAVEVIHRVMAEHPHVATRLVIAGRATQTGQKVHNLRAGTARLSPRVEYLTFIDSDARPRREWLRLLVGRLSRPGTGAVTGYRWFVPIKGSLPNHLLYGMNCNVMSLLGRSSHYLIWGGSWGIRRYVFESIGLHGAWAGTLTDDLMASRLLRRARLPVRFEPGCVVASPLDYSMKEMLSFSRRQYLIGRCYMTDWWVLALLGTTCANLAWLGSLIALGSSMIVGTPSPWIPLSASVVLYLLSVTRGLLRQDLVRTYFPGRQPSLRRAARFDVWLGPVVGLANWLGVVGSLCKRHVTWRGIRYRVLSDGQVRELIHQGEPPRPPALDLRCVRQADDSDHRRPPGVPLRNALAREKAG